LSIAILIEPTQEYKGFAVFAVIAIATIIAFILKIPNNVHEITEINKIRSDYDKYLQDMKNKNALAMEKWQEECEEVKKLFEKDRELIEEENERSKAINQKNRLLYENAVERWEELYYCYRDDSVFMPGEGTYAPGDRMEEYLSQEGKE
jgi:hypothetical protein